MSKQSLSYTNMHLSEYFSVLISCFDIITYIIVFLYIAHELRAWPLHYSPVVICGIIHEDYYQHHLLLVEAIYLLLRNSITTADISQSSELLNKYCFLFSHLYGKIY